MKTQARLDIWEQKILTHQMAVFARLVARVDYITDLNAAQALLRVLEAAARRIVLVLALLAPPLRPHAPRPMSRVAASALANAPKSGWPSRCFSLVESLPGYATMAKCLAPRDKSPRLTRIALPSLGLANHASATPKAIEPAPDDIGPWDRIVARLAALQDVAARPEHHANRLRRWFARQQRLRETNRLARPSPLLPGRSNALKRGDFLHPTRRPRDDAQLLLWEVTQLAFKAQGP